jgi:hypothetical protein
MVFATAVNEYTSAIPSTRNVVVRLSSCVAVRCAASSSAREMTATGCPATACRSARPTCAPLAPGAMPTSTRLGAVGSTALVLT